MKNGDRLDLKVGDIITSGPAPGSDQFGLHLVTEMHENTFQTSVLDFSNDSEITTTTFWISLLYHEDRPICLAFDGTPQPLQAQTGHLCHCPRFELCNWGCKCGGR